jgi:hypothetical protein
MDAEVRISIYLPNEFNSILHIKQETADEEVGCYQKEDYLQGLQGEGYQPVWAVRLSKKE